MELAGERQQQAADGSEEDISVDLVVPVFEEPQAASTSDVAAPTGAAATPENKSNPVEVIAAINAFLKSEWDAVEQGSNHSDTADENHSRMLSDTEDEEDAQTDGKLEDDLVDEEKHNGVQQELRPTMQRIETPPDDEMLEIKVSPPLHKKEEPTEERPLSNTPTTAVTLPTFVFDSVLVDAPEPASVDVEDSPASRRRQLVDRLKTDPPSNATIDEITASFMEDIMHEAVELAKLSFIDHAHLVDVVKPNFEASACVQGAEELITRIEPRMYRSIPTFPRDALDDAFGALTVDVVNEAMSAVFTDATDKKHSLVAKLFGAPTISGKELSAKALAAVKKWTDHKPTDGDNLDRMLTEEVKREERKWMDLEPEEDAVCEAVFDGLWDDLLEDVVHGLDAFERCRSERQRIATVVQ